ncbi:MAG: DegV family protein [Oscillospiraceae bacterium]|nr:DegV family protein [Oscillospiraceae bacterium]
MNQQKIAILADSCADISPEVLAGRKEVFVVPLKILCKDGEFYDGVDIFAPDVYARQAKGELPRTSLPDGATMERTLDEIAAQGYEKVIALMLSGGLSGTYNMMRIYGEERKDLDVRVYDTRNGSLGIGIMVYQLLLDMDAGLGWEELLKRAEHYIGNTFPFFSVDTLEFLQKGGRIGRVTALAGTMLQIKPIIIFDHDGQLKSTAKVRGRRQLIDRFVELVKQKVGSHARYNIAVAHGGAFEAMQELGEKLKQALPNYIHYWEGELDATLSTYIGSGVLGAGVQLL